MSSSQSHQLTSTPNGIRTRAAAVKGRCPRPLDDGGLSLAKAFELAGAIDLDHHRPKRFSKANPGASEVRAGRKDSLQRRSTCRHHFNLRSVLLVNQLVRQRYTYRQRGSILGYIKYRQNS